MNDSAHCQIDALTLREPGLIACRAALERALELLAAAARHDGLILACGNGGSAADSAHIVGELMKGFNLMRPLPPEEAARFAASWPEGGAAMASKLQRAIRAIDLTAQSSLISAFANDVDPELVYAQEVYGYGRAGDALVAISTSGSAANVVAAARAARARGMAVIGFSGRDGGRLAQSCDALILAPGATTLEIQQGHLSCYHALCAALEVELFAE